MLRNFPRVEATQLHGLKVQRVSMNVLVQVQVDIVVKRDRQSWHSSDSFANAHPQLPRKTKQKGLAFSQNKLGLARSLENATAKEPKFWKLTN